MKNLKIIGSLFVLSLVLLCSCGKTYKYETVPNDPLKARIYTLDNGLKVYLTVYKDAPRIQTFIPVRVGGKNDPSETTGLAHYFEHLMFKGTEQFGTQNFELEKPMLDRIEELFEVYRNTTDENERRAIYKVIDSVSYEASKLSIPNEYDKLMAAIGATGTNAFTSNDLTCYMEEIPSNQIENWAKIQSDRFANTIIRGFHTELETVYEEKNMSLTNDNRKVSEIMLATLFPHHPYGTQTVLGTQEHLKNPSITNIKNYFKTYYVPNNMAICMSGDFDPDETIKIIDKYFGSLAPNPNIPPVKADKEQPITAPITKEVLGNDAEFITVAWRVPGIVDQESEVCELVDYILNNGKAGLIDLNLNQKQRTLGASAGYYNLNDMGAFLLRGRPRQGQTLDQVKDLLLEQIELLKKGEFEDWLLEATINNFKLDKIRELEDNTSRAFMLVDAFSTDADWADAVGKLERMGKITKNQIVDFANRYFQDNYVVIYKRTGKDPNELKIDKPTITPIETNRDAESQFLTEIKNTKVTPINPVFLDYEKDLNKLAAKSDIPVLYKKNVENDLFELDYLFDMGTENDKALGLAFSYLKYLGTSKYTPEDIQSEFYKMACSFYVQSAYDRVYVGLNGLSENMGKAIDLLEDLLADAQINEEAFNNMIADQKKTRSDAKLNQSRIFGMLRTYAMWGKNSPATNILSNNELNTLKPQDLIDRVKNLNNYEHRILYYGPMNEKDFLAEINNRHKVADKLSPVPEAKQFTEQITKENTVLFAPYDAKQIYFAMVSKRGEKYDDKMNPVIQLYNAYFGGGMNAIVFQEMREARGLAYSAWASYSEPSRKDRTYTYMSYIATQNDKMDDAVKAFNEIINNMPESENAFDIAKENLMTNLRTQRITKSSVIWDYINAEQLGLNYDRRKVLFDNIPNLTLADVKTFQEQHIKDRLYTYCILGSEKDLDFKAMESYGKLKKLTLEEIFGY